MLLGHGLHETPAGRRIIHAFDAAMDTSILPFIVTAEEGAAVRTVATTAAGATDVRAVQDSLTSQLDDLDQVGAHVLRASVGGLRRLWLHHVGLASPGSLAICRAVERSGALHVGVFTAMADADVDTIADALPSQASIVFRTLLGDRPVGASD